jgi:hypothetical protein
MVWSLMTHEAFRNVVQLIVDRTHQALSRPLAAGPDFIE